MSDQRQSTEVVPDNHAFTKNPHRTLFHLTIPVLFSLVAEPLTGLVDTAFVARLGSVPLAALGVGTIVLSSIYWIFNFLSVGTQTEVAQLWGRNDRKRACEINAMSVSMSLVFGCLMILVGWPLVPAAVKWMGAADPLLAADAAEYIYVRLFGAPAVLITLAGFGSLRGLQDMKKPLHIAVTINLINLLLDYPFIFGFGEMPGMGVAGAALASVVSQWIGAIWVLAAIRRKLGFPARLNRADIGRLLQIGGDLFVRTGMLTLFLVIATRAATQIGSESGAAHQAIRQVWIFTALFLDAFAITGQSLVGYFLGGRRLKIAREVARVVCWWSLATGIALALLMLATTDGVIALLVPADAAALFTTAWIINAFAQPLNSLAFATDGIHWGSGDFRFLRNVVIIATAVGVAIIFMLDLSHPRALAHIWLATAVWILIRSVLGMLRIWPGIGRNTPWSRPS